MYGRASGNVRESARLYQEPFLNRHQPDHKIFTAMFERRNEIVTVWRKNLFADKGSPRTHRTANFEKAVLDCVAENPDVSIRHLAKILSVVHSS